MMALGFSTRVIAAIVVLSWAAVAAPLPATKGFNVKTLSFDEGYAPLFGDGNLVRSSDGRSVRLHLNQYSGSGFISSDLYQYGLFSASIKLPSDYTAGVVVAFYTSNGDMFEKTHDELDLEFLGNIKGKEWRLQTNVYGNGSTSRGREERYLLPFDPTAEAHRYSILWTSDTIIFYVDDTPIREVKRSEAMGADYPTKPMMLYATIWDGSSWATSGGKYKVNYKYSPFISEFSSLVLQGCRMDPIQQLPVDEQCADAEAELAAADYSRMTPDKRQAMRKFRERYMTYSFCYDTLRYPITFPDCDIVPAEQRRFTETGDIKNMPRRRRSKHRSKFFSGSVDSERQADI
ncbi:probable xyloglucan endotransglucosylase/hydrolase protein 30 [Dioscorea cayenensis subsp. rotundata]|uniref:Xyloglucan endotransglucosylase/hydrolase n=1 Tax=Dioscorea cayennensis subsp. rotundata TaxID=55577 RepID=A0AB40B5H2_DIOCR|nr:probable xyloglucan endotransglucosylase/hydrolase protein 30 [Dioscorea cayenensis subsp. rotundata]